MNDQSDQQRKFLGVHTVLCGVVKHWQLRVWGMLGGIRGVKYCRQWSAKQIAICQKRLNSIFSSLEMPPLLSAARGGCPLSPLPAATAFIMHSLNITCCIKHGVKDKVHQREARTWLWYHGGQAKWGPERQSFSSPSYAESWLDAIVHNVKLWRDDIMLLQHSN